MNNVGPNQANAKSLRYAQVFKGRLKQHFEQVMNDPGNPLDLLPELEVQRTILRMALDRLSQAIDQGTAPDGTILSTNVRGNEGDSLGNAEQDMAVSGGGEALHDVMEPVDIHLSQFSDGNGGKPGRPRKSMAVDGKFIEDIRLMLQDVTNTVNKIVLMRAKTAMTKAEVMWLFSTLREAVRLYVPKDKQKAFVEYVMSKVPVGSIDGVDEEDEGETFDIP